jgi:hypothetical protein
MYNNKPFLRGSTHVSYPCTKCECHNHATSCYYNQTFDPFPRDRARGGGGVCINCQHHTAGQYCDSCEEGYYRETGKNLTDADVCTPCRCSGPGVKPRKLDCVKVCCLVTFCHTQLGVEKESDHGTIGPRKFFEFPENISPRKKNIIVKI